MNVDITPNLQIHNFVLDTPTVTLTELILSKVHLAHLFLFYSKVLTVKKVLLLVQQENCRQEVKQPPYCAYCNHESRLSEQERRKGRH